MAPGLVETVPTEDIASQLSKQRLHHGAYKDVGATLESFNKNSELKGTANQPKASYPNYLPVWDNETTRLAPLEPFEHYDHGKDADPLFPDLLPAGKADVEQITPGIGSEVHGVQLSQLTKEGKDQLALFVAQRKVVAFRGQDLADLPIDKALDWGSYFGRHHVHPVSGAPKGYPEMHLVHRGADERAGPTLLEDRINTVAWHSDVTYEEQPPGTTFLYILDGPSAGGDTLFANQALAYRRLSPEFRKRLHGLKALHSGHEQAQFAVARGGIVRREPVANIHPLVRTHPVTGEKALFVNQQFTRHIIGYKREESDALLNFLYNHIALSQDLQIRLKWAPGTVIAWDNRVTAHSALLDWEDGQRRHLARITPQADAPFETPFEGK